MLALPPRAAHLLLPVGGHNQAFTGLISYKITQRDEVGFGGKGGVPEVLKSVLRAHQTLLL